MRLKVRTVRTNRVNARYFESLTEPKWRTEAMTRRYGVSMRRIIPSAMTRIGVRLIVKVEKRLNVYAKKFEPDSSHWLV